LSEDRTQLLLDNTIHGLTNPEETFLFQAKTPDDETEDDRLVIVYTYDSNGVDPNKYQDWLEAGSPREAVDDTLHSYYFKTGGNVPLRPSSVAGDTLTYPVQLDAIEGDVRGYVVTTGRTIDIGVTGKNNIYRSTVRGNPVEISVQMPSYLTGTFVDHLNNNVHYGFRFVDEHTFAASAIGTSTFLTINPVESSQIKSQFDISIS
jgi:hypothetical protein